MPSPLPPLRIPSRFIRPHSDSRIEKHPSVTAFSCHAGYRGTAATLIDDVLGLLLHISMSIKDRWTVLPKRWIVERTLAWLGSYRRLSKDVEILPATDENAIRIAMLSTTLANCI